MPKRSIRPIRIKGNIAYVPLTKGYEAIIDAEDAEFIGQWNWCALENRHTVYAARRDIAGGKASTVCLHRVLLVRPEGFMVDHVDGNGLNNRRSNLRLASHAENSRNRRKNTNNKSGHKGVYWVEEMSKWRAQIRFNGKAEHLGYYDSFDAARIAYCDASVKVHGEFGRVL